MITSFLHWLGFGLCHQLPDRSFFGGGVQVPVCARDTGIYVGFMISFIVLRLIHGREHPREFARGSVWAICILLVGFMGWDGVTSYAGLRETTNALRLLTGACAGFAIAVIIVPMLDDVLWADASATRVLDPAWRVGVWLIALPVSVAMIWFVGPLLGIMYPVTVGVAIVATLTVINLVIVGMLPSFDRHARQWKDLLLPIVLALGLTFGEVWLSFFVKLWIVRLAGAA